MIRVLFVCLGNICRSPMAEGVLRHLIADAGLSDQIEVDSAGTSDWHVGEKAHRGTRSILKKNGIDYYGRARQFTITDLDHFDYILTMDRSNLSDIWNKILRDEYPLSNVVERDGRQIEVRPFLHYAHDAGLVHTLEVPDPYYSNSFESVYKLVHIGCVALLDYIRQKHGL